MASGACIYIHESKFTKLGHVSCQCVPGLKMQYACIVNCMCDYVMCSIAHYNPSVPAGLTAHLRIQRLVVVDL